jgi:hypothetical protein
VTVNFSGVGLLVTTHNLQTGGFTCLTWVTLPGAYAPASIALRVITARKPPTYDKAVDLEVGTLNIQNYNFPCRSEWGPKRMWEDTIKMDVRMGWYAVD